MDIEKAFSFQTAIVHFVINKLIPSFLIFLIGWFLAGFLTKTIKKAMTRAHIDESIISFSNSVLKVVFRGVVLLIVVSCLGVNISSIIATLGAALLTVGLALKDNLSNIASGTIIIINKPFKIGDFLETNNIKGTVTKIEMLFTTLLTADNKEIVIPNSKLTSNYIINSTVKKIRRLDITVPIKNSTKFSDLKPIIDAIIKESTDILSDPKPNIFLNGFEQDYFNLSVEVWCHNKDYNKLKKLISEKIKDEFDKNNIDF